MEESPSQAASGCAMGGTLCASSKVRFMGEVCDEESSSKPSEKSRSEEAIESSKLEGASAMLESRTCRRGKHGASRIGRLYPVCLPE